MSAAIKPNGPNTRRENRRTLSGKEFPGKVLVSSGKQLKIAPMDVSAHGVGLKINHEILPELSLTMHIGSHAIELHLRWGILDVATQSYRYGFEAVDDSLNLEKIFAEHNIN